ncbi:hypothetical protein C8R47DRAFT_1193473 [Mycena vitilis]|nr:hypothetical protein C8R47DRAFT_1193473 [Mycena vitilis]
MLSLKPNVLDTVALMSVENQVKGLIAAAEANIQYLKTQIRELGVICDRERSMLATLRLMIVPIGKLPTELLMEIFKMAVHAVVQLERRMSSCGYIGDPRAALRQTLCLSQVSPYWRQIIHHSRQLWAEGVVDIRLGGEVTPYLDGLETLLSRSDPLPISVSVAPVDKRRSPLLPYTTIPRALIPTAHRWESLSIRLRSFTALEGLSSAMFEALDSLSITGFQRQKGPVMAFQSSPRLRKFTLYTEGAALTRIGLFHLPWSQLTHLEVGDVSLRACHSALLQCCHIIRASIATSCEWDLPSSPAETPATILPFLDHLTLEFRGPYGPNPIHGLEAFILPLSLPSLRTLTMESIHDDGPQLWPTTVFSAFQLRASKMEKISIRSYKICSTGAITLLRNGPTLTNLTLTDSGQCISDHFFQALRFNASDSTPLAPQLQHIHLSDVGTGFTPGALEAVIRSRWWKDAPGGSPSQVSRLKSVVVSCIDDVVDAKLEEYCKAGMYDLVEQGLHLQLT